MKNLSSDISKAKNYGSSRSGVGHWMWQRLTAVFLIPCYLWFIYIFLKFFINPEVVVTEVLYSLFPFVLFLAMINVTLIHGVMGFKVVVEDYVHSEFLKNFILVASYFVTFATMLIVSLTLIVNFIVNI